MFKRAVHPGEFLKGELEEFGVTAAEFARQISVPANRVQPDHSWEAVGNGEEWRLRFGHWFRR